MHLTLQGHDYRYAAEQMMLTLFPEERPDYAPAPDGANAVLLTLTAQGDTLHARAALRWQGRETAGEDSAPLPSGADALVRDRVCQRILKLAFYRAGAAALGGGRGAAGDLPGLPGPGRPGPGLRSGQPAGQTEPAGG